jgi:hypothetical protein
MDMMTMFLKGMGISPEIFAQTQELFIGIAQTVQRIEAQLGRIETNTMMLLDGMGTAPAAPTRYDLMPVLDALPPIAGEPEQARQAA